MIDKRKTFDSTRRVLFPRSLLGTKVIVRRRPGVVWRTTMEFRIKLNDSNTTPSFHSRRRVVFEGGLGSRSEFLQKLLEDFCVSRESRSYYEHCDKGSYTPWLFTRHQCMLLDGYKCTEFNFHSKVAKEENGEVILGPERAHLRDVLNLIAREMNIFQPCGADYIRGDSSSNVGKTEGFVVYPPNYNFQNYGQVAFLSLVGDFKFFVKTDCTVNEEQFGVDAFVEWSNILSRDAKQLLQVYRAFSEDGYQVHVFSCVEGSFLNFDTDTVHDLLIIGTDVHNPGELVFFYNIGD